MIFIKKTDRYFFDYFQEILLMFGFIAKNNIKLVKDRLKRLGVSPKFKPVYEKIPFKILKTSAFNALVENQFDLSTTVRAIEDLKLIKIINDNDYILDIMPKEIIELMQLIIRKQCLKTTLIV